MLRELLRQYIFSGTSASKYLESSTKIIFFIKYNKGSLKTNNRSKLNTKN